MGVRNADKKKKNVAFRKEKKKYASAILVIAVVGAFLLIFTHNSGNMQTELDGLNHNVEQVRAQLEEEKARAEELKQFETYTHTKKYAEQVAKEKLGYVYEGEIIFQKDN
ncbi:MAG: septum formation initiator family protein [Lachnospiraceae bacterium]|nr:septum formation initiator family protein [Lachnospiraceae bacterium]